MWRQLSGKKWKCWDVLPIMREKWWVSAVLWLFAKHQSSWFVCVWCVPNKKKVLAKKIVKLEEEHEYEEYGDMTSISSADWGRWRCYISICEDDTNVDINERIIEAARREDDQDDTRHLTTGLLDDCDDDEVWWWWWRWQWLFGVYIQLLKCAIPPPLLVRHVFTTVEFCLKVR